MTFDQLLDFLRGRGMDRLAFLFQKYEAEPEVAELKELLPAIGKRLRAEGLIPEEAPPVPVAPAVPTGLSPAEEAVLPLLRELDAALAQGGPQAAMETFNTQIKSTSNRNAYLAVLAA